MAGCSLHGCGVGRSGRPCARHCGARRRAIAAVNVLTAWLALVGCAGGGAGGVFSFEVPISREAAVVLSRLREVTISVSLSSQRLGGEPVDVGRVPALVRREGPAGRLLAPIAMDHLVRAGGLGGGGNVIGERSLRGAPPRRQEVGQGDPVKVLGAQDENVSEASSAPFWLDIGCSVSSGEVPVLQISAQLEINPGSPETGGFEISVDPGLISVEYPDGDTDEVPNLLEIYVGSDPDSTYVEPATEQLQQVDAFVDSAFETLPTSSDEALDVTGEPPTATEAETAFVSAAVTPPAPESATQLVEEDLALLTVATAVAAPVEQTPLAPVPADVIPPPVPAIGSTSPPSPSRQLYPLIGGTAEAGSIVWLAANGTLVGNGIVDASGSFLLAPGSPPTANAMSALVVWAVDAAGNVSGNSAPFYYVHDDLPPSGGIVNDGAGADVDSGTSGSSIASNWSGFYDPTGIGRYDYCLATARSCGCDILAPAAVGLQQSFVANGLALRSGTTYFNCVRASDGAGNAGAWVASDGISITLSTRRDPARRREEVGGR